MKTKHSILKSFAFAFTGIKAALKEEPNFKIHILLAIAALIIAYFSGLSSLQLVTLVLTISLVLTLELINTSLEALVDLVSPEKNERAKIAKDVAAAAVLIASVTAITVGGVLFLPKILSFLALTR